MTTTNNANPQNNRTDNNYECKFCLFSTEILQDLKQHMQTHSQSIQKPFKCPECPYIARAKADVKIHVRNVHLLKSPSALRPFPCTFPGCNYAAKHKGNFNQHLRIHESANSFICSHPNCNFSTKHKISLALHTRVHTGEKPFACRFESCSFAAATSSNLVVHTRTHTKERPFKCPESNCEYSTARPGDLKVHQLTHRPKEGEERPSFPCPLCEYKGKSKAHLAKHIKRYTLEKFFKCDEPSCNFEAKTKAHRKSHMLVHSDEKPFACSFERCAFRSKYKGALQLHVKAHSDEKQYKCELCPFRAKQRINVVTHLESLHSDLRPFKCTEPKCEYAAKRKEHVKTHMLFHNGKN